MTTNTNTSGIDAVSPAHSNHDHEKGISGPGSVSDNEKREALEPVASNRSLGLSDPSRTDSTHRMLKSRHIQLIGIGGTIGTALYV